MKKFVFVSMILLVAAVSVNADVTGASLTRVATAPAVGSGYASNITGAGITSNRMSLQNSSGEIDIVAQNFVLNSAINLTAFAAQLSQISTATDNFYMSSSWTTATGPLFTVQIYQFTGSDITTQWQEVADQRGPGQSNTGYAPDWTLLGTASTANLTNSMNTTSATSHQWLNMDLSGLNLTLQAGTIYSARIQLVDDGSHGAYIRFARDAQNDDVAATNANGMFLASYSRNSMDSAGQSATSTSYPVLGPLGAAMGLGGYGNAATVMQYEVIGTAVPEPATIALLSLGGLFLLRKKKA